MAPATLSPLKEDWMADIVAGWFPVFTLLLGYAMKAFSDWLQHRRTTEREREARAAARQDERANRRVAFQRQTLLDLQEAMMQLIRSAGAMHHRDVMEFRKTGKWQKQLFGEELNENARLANARTSMLAVRVRDDPVRDLVQTVKSHAIAAAMCGSQEEGERAMTAMGAAFEQLNQRIGETLRKLDDT
jgi:hypothetical protein